MKRITLDSLRRAVEAQSDPLTGMLVERAILHGAFRLVADKNDWRAPIDAVVHADLAEFDGEVIARAVQFFTGTDAAVVETDAGLHVRAIGYRAGPCGP